MKYSISSDRMNKLVYQILESNIGRELVVASEPKDRNNEGSGFYILSSEEYKDAVENHLNKWWWSTITIDPVTKIIEMDETTYDDIQNLLPQPLNHFKPVIINYLKDKLPKYKKILSSPPDDYNLSHSNPMNIIFKVI